MKKVLFVINTMGRAGAETALLELLDRLAGRDIELSLYVLTGQGELINRLPENVKLCNDRFSDTEVLSEEGRRYLRKTVLRAAVHHGSGVRNLPYMIRNGAAMIRKKRIQPDKLLWRVLSDGGMESEEEYDLAVSFLEGGAAYYVADHVKAKRKAAFIHIAYGQAGYTRKLDKECYIKFDRIFTVSGEVKEHFLYAYPECVDKTYVFHNILNEDRIRQMSEIPGGFTDDFDGIRILTVGRLVYQKAYDIAISAMKILKQEINNQIDKKVRWYVLGDGELRQELTEQIEKANLKEDFILLGASDNPYPYFAQTDIYAHFTRFEGKSIAIQEAQILGKPIVASDCSGNREQITDGVDGLLAPLEPDKMAETLSYMIYQPERAHEMGIYASGKQIAYEKDIELLLEML